MSSVVRLHVNHSTVITLAVNSFHTYLKKKVI